jgi:enoyl-CoA hydratase/carnithine racemase
VSAVVPDADLVAHALRLARRIAAQPPDALRTTTRLLHAGRTDAWRAAIERENAEFSRLAGGPENLAAIERFFAKT